MLYCVRLNTTKKIEESATTSAKTLIQNAINAGFTTEQFEILTQDEYEDRKAIVPLDDLKEYKTKELNDACNYTILGRFKAEIDGTEYEFSYDYEAQSRFNGIGVLFFANKINEIEWTAYRDGERVRIILNQINFDIVTMAALAHQNNNIIKYNQLLQQVKAAKTKEQIEAIVWDD